MATLITVKGYIGPGETKYKIYNPKFVEGGIKADFSSYHNGKYDKCILKNGYWPSEKISRLFLDSKTIK